MFFSKFFCKEKHVLETCGTICFLPIKEAVKMDEDIILVCSFTLIKKFIIQYFPWLGFIQHIIFFNIFFEMQFNRLHTCTHNLTYKHTRFRPK